MNQKAKRGQHLSVCDLADILKLITASPMTARQVFEQHKTGLVVLRRLLRCMVQLDVAHVSGWDHSIRGTPAAIFAGGSGENVEPPLNRDGSATKTPWAKGARIRPSANMIMFGALVRALDEGATVAELVERVGCNPATAARFVNHMRRLGLAHIGAWHQSWTGYPSRVFMLGAGRDVRRPKPLDAREKSLRNYHARQAKAKQAAINSALFATELREAA